MLRIDQIGKRDYGHFGLIPLYLLLDFFFIIVMLNAKIKCISIKYFIKYICGIVYFSNEHTSSNILLKL